MRAWYTGATMWTRLQSLPHEEPERDVPKELRKVSHKRNPEWLAQQNTYEFVMESQHGFCMYGLRLFVFLSANIEQCNTLCAQ